MRAALLACALLLTSGAGGATMQAAAQAQRARAPGTHPEAARLDALLAADETASVGAWLASHEAALSKDDRLAFDTIYVLVRRGRLDEARAQWNTLATRLAEGLRTAATAGSSASAADQRRLGEALFAQAVLLGRGGERDEALRLLRQADGYGFPPLDSPLMVLAADTLRELGEHALAANAYREYLRRSPADVTARLALATSLYASRKFDDARVELEDVARRAPATAGAHYLLGAVLAELSQYEAARTHLTRELTTNPRCIGCLSRLAHVAYLEGKDAECAALLGRAAAIDPTDIETRMIEGLLAFRTGKYEAAVDHLSYVVERSPSYIAARYQLAMAYRRVGNNAKAAEQLAAYQRLLQEQKARDIGVRGQ